MKPARLRKKKISKGCKLKYFTMGNFIIKCGVKIERTPEQIAEIERWKKKTDDDIDYSDIPPLTDEELSRMKPARLRKKNLKRLQAKIFYNGQFYY